jgi:hypothetical protein
MKMEVDSKDFFLWDTHKDTLQDVQIRMNRRVHSSASSEAGTIGPILAVLPDGLRLISLNAFILKM